MGTPDFAVPCLDILLQNGFDVVAVVTVPDKPSGRGLNLSVSAVNEFAVQHNLVVLQPEKLRDETFLQTLRDLKPDLNVVVAFRMLPEIVWSLPTYGSINLHASILPKYRGAAPINWAIINGEKETGVTTFFIQKQIDTGNIIDVAKVAIDNSDTAGTLHDKLMETGAQLMLKTVKSIEAKNYVENPQDLSVEQPLAPKIFKEHCKINWHQPAEQVYNFIRGLSPYPAAFTLLNGKVLKIFAASVTSINSFNSEGTIISDKKKTFIVNTSNLQIQIEELQLEGKKRMKTEEFLRGYNEPLTTFQ